MPLAATVLRELWTLAALPSQALSFVDLPGEEDCVPSSFAAVRAAQASMAAAGLAACELGHARGQPRQGVRVDAVHAALECLSWFSVNGVAPNIWDAFSGLYRCADGWLRLHANFAHHRDGAIRLLGLEPATATRQKLEKAFLGWRATDFEDRAAALGLVATATRSFAQWDALPQAQCIARQPLWTLERIGDAPPRALVPLNAAQRPLEGVRVLDLTRILAGPVGCRALAGYGADVMMLNGPHLPNIPAIADLSLGKRSAQLDLRLTGDKAHLDGLLSSAHVLVQAYRPGALAGLGFGPQQLANQCPGLVLASLCAYGDAGPWAERRGFDSLVQNAMGFNIAEAQAAGQDGPKALPFQVLDHASGFLLALGVAAALRRQQSEGGTWHVKVSLAQTGQWLHSLGRLEADFSRPVPDMTPYLDTHDSGFGAVRAVRHAVQFERTPVHWRYRAEPPGTHAPIW